MQSKQELKIESRPVEAIFFKKSILAEAYELSVDMLLFKY